MSKVTENLGKKLRQMYCEQIRYVLKTNPDPLAGLFWMILCTMKEVKIRPIPTVCMSSFMVLGGKRNSDCIATIAIPLKWGRRGG